MKLWLLECKPGFDANWDETNGCVIRAKTENEARLLANEESYNEKDKWLDKNKTSCEQLVNKGKAGVILVDYNAG